MAAPLVFFRSTLLGDELILVHPPTVDRGGSPIFKSSLGAQVKAMPGFDNPNKSFLWRFTIQIVRNSDRDFFDAIMDIVDLIDGNSGDVTVLDENTALWKVFPNVFFIGVTTPTKDSGTKGAFSGSTVLTFTGVERPR